MIEARTHRMRFSLRMLLLIITLAGAYGGGWYHGLHQGLDEGFDERAQLHKEVAALRTKQRTLERDLEVKEQEVTAFQITRNAAIEEEVALRISKRDHEAFERRFNAERRALGLPEEKFGP